MKYRVRLWGIQWDDGKGEYDVSRLPSNLEIELRADNEADAIESALDEATDRYSMLIADTDKIEISLED